MSELIDAAETAIPGVGQIKVAWLAVKSLLKFLPYVGIALALAWGAWERSEAQHWHKTADSCSVARKLDQATWQASYDKSVADATIAKLATEANAAKITKENDDALQGQLDDANARADRYARLHPASSANQNAVGKANLPGPGADTKIPDSPDQSSVVVTRTDFDTCTEDVTRLQNARVDAFALIAPAQGSTP
jgi:hypothetical protein